MITRTICCKLQVSHEAREALEETLLRFSSACNDVLTAAIAEKTSNAIQLHKLMYLSIRASHGLSANLAVRAIRRVAGAMTRLKGARKLPKLFKPRSVDYDARIFSFWEEKELISLTTTRGRYRIPLVLGEYQRKALQGQSPKSATVIKKGEDWYIHMVVERKQDTAQGHLTLGVDLGIKNIASTSSGLKISGKERAQFKKDRQRVRSSLQSKNTRGAKRRLKALSGKERRRIRHENHVLAKQLVNEAKRHNCGLIRMEQLKGIRDRTKTWNPHLNRMVAGWSFYQLQKFVTDKAQAAGLLVETINPSYTSQTCCKCLRLGSRNGERFSCTTCGDCHADLNAASVIALGGVACKPTRINGSC